MKHELAANSNISNYRIVSKIGAGGMGEVYRAYDSRLDREVAIKALPANFASDPERLARFDREAKILASLNHPGIASIYAVVEERGGTFLVIELVEGETLGELLERRPLPIEQALELAEQIAEAIEAAHSRSIIHRDLKPANIMISPEGKVKVLDFGLARSSENANSRMDRPEMLESPTMAWEGSRHSPTIAGTIMGSAGYMSPEQVRGEDLDKRSDIFAFGCLLYEMLSGTKPFWADTLADTLASTLKSEPDLAALPFETPPEIKRLMVRCLVKDKRNRLQDIGDARIEIRSVLSGERLADPEVPQKDPGSTGLRYALLIPAIAGAVLITGGISWLVWGYGRHDIRSRQPGTYVVTSIGIDSASLVWLTDRFAVAPDGSSIVFLNSEGLFIRKPDQIIETPLPGAPKDAYAPVFSPDGKWIAFGSANNLLKIPVGGGAPEILARTNDYVINLTWGRDDVIRFPSREWDTIRYVSAKGGPLQSIGFEKGTRVSRAEWLPGDRLVVSLTDANGDFICIREPDGSIRRLFEGRDAKLTPDNHLLFTKQDGTKTSLMSVPISIESGSVAGRETLVAQNVAMRYATPAGANAAGDVFFVAGEVRSDRRLVILSRDGTERVLDGAQGPWQTLRMSVDGTRLALSRWDGARRTIWTLALESGALTQITYLDDTFEPVWVPGSDDLLFTQFPRYTNMYGTTMWRVTANGSGDVRPLFEHPESYVASTSQDGTIVYYSSDERRDGSGDIFALDLSQQPYKSSTILATPAAEGDPLVSPDGKWLAYTTNSSGSAEVRVTSLVNPGNSTQITTSTGSPVRWMDNSSKLYYRDGDAIASIDVGSNGPVLASRKSVFKKPNDTRGFVDVFPDGERAITIRGGLLYSDLIVVQGFLAK